MKRLRLLDDHTELSSRVACRRICSDPHEVCFLPVFAENHAFFCPSLPSRFVHLGDVDSITTDLD